MGVFVTTYAPNLLRETKFSLPTSLPGCDVNCTAFALPGGLETVRRVNHSLNHTIFEDYLFDDVETILVTNAPGYLLRYESLGADFFFDVNEDCSIYGAHMNESIQMCVRSANSSLIVGE